MAKYLLIIWLIFLGYSCNRTGQSESQSEPQFELQSEPHIDTTVIKYEPNRVVKTEHIGSDASKKSITKIEYYYDSLLTQEIYRSYQSSEGSLLGDVTNQYFYDKYKKLKFRYSIDNYSKDTVKYCYRYYEDTSEYDAMLYSFKKRMINKLPSGHVVTPEDLTEKRIWVYDKFFRYNLNEQGKLIKWYLSAIDGSLKGQHETTLKYVDNRLQEISSFFNDTCVVITKYEYHGNKTIITYNDIKENSKKTKITKQDKNGNTVLVKEFDSKGKLLYKSSNFYDKNNRLVRMEYASGDNDRKFTHKVTYEDIK